MRVVKIYKIIKTLEKDGWYIDRTRGSHRQFKHPTKKGTVTVNGKPSDDVWGTQFIMAFIKQAYYEKSSHQHSKNRKRL